MCVCVCSLAWSAYTVHGGKTHQQVPGQEQKPPQGEPENPDKLISVIYYHWAGIEQISSYLQLIQIPVILADVTWLSWYTPSVRGPLGGMCVIVEIDQRSGGVSLKLLADWHMAAMSLHSPRRACPSAPTSARWSCAGYWTTWRRSAGRWRRTGPCLVRWTHGSYG